MAHTDHHAPYRLREIPAQRAARNTHSLDVSLASRAAGPHRYRDENGTGEKVTLRREVRRRDRQATRSEAREHGLRY
jgi:hypothetical protein